MILAVDPGLRGALAWTDGTALAVRDMPTRMGAHRTEIDPEGVEKLLRSCRLRTEIFLIEQVNGMPGQSGPAAFTFGEGYGLLCMCAQVLGYRVERVPAARWKFAMACPADKSLARQRASEIWPGHRDDWPLKKHDGRAEAALIAAYGWKVFGSL